jgi:hypothetical protein
VPEHNLEEAQRDWLPAYQRNTLRRSYPRFADFLNKEFKSVLSATGNDYGVCVVVLFGGDTHRLAAMIEEKIKTDRFREAMGSFLPREIHADPEYQMVHIK